MKCKIMVLSFDIFPFLEELSEFPSTRSSPVLLPVFISPFFRWYFLGKC